MEVTPPMSLMESSTPPPRPRSSSDRSGDLRARILAAALADPAGPSWVYVCTGDQAAPYVMAGARFFPGRAAVEAVADLEQGQLVAFVRTHPELRAYAVTALGQSRADRSNSR